MKAAQRGVAVIMAMAVAAIAAIVAGTIMLTQSAAVRQQELIDDRAQAQALLGAGVDWARSIQSDDRRATNADHLGEPWALRLALIPVERGRVKGYIDDQQGALNLNNLVIANSVNFPRLAQFRRLLAMMGLPVTLADAVVDWIDADSRVQGAGGAEDDYYLNLPTPYRAANRPLADIDELLLVRGFDAEVLARLRPFVTALPRVTPVNVNTAPAEVLAALVEGLDLESARALVAQRARFYYRSPAEFSSQLPRGLNAAAADISVASDYFLVNLNAAVSDVESHGTVLLLRDGPGWPTIIWRKYL